MDDTFSNGKRDDKPVYESSMGIVGWLVVAVVIWIAVLVPLLTLS